MSNTLKPVAPMKLTVVEEGTEFKGTLTSSCPIDVRGRVEGELQTPALTISESGAVHGRAKVGQVHSRGEISGEFDADRVELAGVVRDNTVIRARSLDVRLASERGKLQVIFGECELSVGDAPTEADQIAEQQATTAAVPAPAAEIAAAPAPASTLADAIAAATAPVAEPAAADGEEGDDETDEPADAAQAGAPGGKKKRKKKNGHEETGWSHPPSQPPPAN